MSTPRYLWRKLTPGQRDDLLAWRKRQGLPWHRPPHRASEKTRCHVTAACFEHMPAIGLSADRMQNFCGTLLEVFRGRDAPIHAWCVLPNHYHALVKTTDILGVLADLGRMHGRLSFQWNGEEQIRRASLILLMAEGRSIERGTHEDLMQARGEYSRMVLRQMAAAGEEGVLMAG